MLRYNKKVMQHFMHPKNVGKIKDADGTGKVGNIYCGDVMEVSIKVGKKKAGKKDAKEIEYVKDIKFQTMGCLPPTEKISLGNGWESISNISKGDRVLNGEGQRTVIKKVHKSPFRGELIHIIPFVSKFNSFYVTPVHPIQCIKRKFLKFVRKSSEKCDWLRIDERELLSSRPYYAEAAYLEIGDYLIFPKRREIKDSPDYTKSLMKLLGYYLAEGYTTSKESVLNFAFNKNEKEYIGEVCELLKEVLSKSGKVRTRGNVAEIRVCSTKWAKFFTKICGKYAENKKLSDDVLLLPFEKQWEMIKSYIKGDGNIYKRRPKDSVTYRVDTASEQLAIQIQEMLLRGGIFAPIKKFRRPSTYIEGRKLRPFILFNISFKLTKKHKFVRENKEYFLVPIKKIRKKPFCGVVYNLEMQGKNPSYLTKGFVVHNCVAAIATTSVVTSLAKGKSLEKAMKITNKDVVRFLGGLPPIKVHCSLLAEEALGEAIYDYLNKQKKQIPIMLVKKHEKALKAEKEFKRLHGKH